MNSALFQVNIVEEDRKIVSVTYLLNKKRVIDFWTNRDGRVVFYYEDISNRRDKVTEYVYNGNISAFKDLIAESTIRETITINPDKYSVITTGAKAVGYFYDFTLGKVTLNLDYFVKAVARPSSEIGSYVWIARGGFKHVCFRTPDTIDEIDSTASGSGSLN